MAAQRLRRRVVEGAAIGAADGVRAVETMTAERMGL